MLKIWSKGIPLKINFFIRKLRNFKLPVDDVLQSCGINLVSRCRCCLNPQPKIVYHLFVSSDFASNTWDYFTICA